MLLRLFSNVARFMSDLPKTVYFGGFSTGVASVLESPSNYNCRLKYIFGLDILAQNIIFCTKQSCLNAFFYVLLIYFFVLRNLLSITRRAFDQL